MASREREPQSFVGPKDAETRMLAQGSLAFVPEPGGRDAIATLRGLAKALAVLPQVGGHESALRESFVSAMAGFGAEKGVLIQVRQQQPLEVEVLYATGLRPEDEAAFRDLRSSPGISPSLIRRAIEEGGE
jgi:hypothetical protein